jgi:hypothetical protein
MMKNNLHYRIALVLISYALIFSGAVFAGTTSIEGKVEGANCVIEKNVCPVNNDPHLALENDFVLSTADGKYYFLPNLSRSQKIALASKNVRITGDLQGITLLASIIEERKGDSYQEVWNWKKITRSVSR